MPRIEDITIENRGGDRLAAKLNHPLGRSGGGLFLRIALLVPRIRLPLAVLLASWRRWGLGFCALILLGWGLRKGLLRILVLALT